MMILDLGEEKRTRQITTYASPSKHALIPTQRHYYFENFN